MEPAPDVDPELCLELFEPDDCWEPELLPDDCEPLLVVPAAEPLWATMNCALANAAVLVMRNNEATMSENKFIRFIMIISFYGWTLMIQRKLLAICTLTHAS
ncbi:MAG TPA: hypothetical protein VK141_09790 [Nitrosomonas sp.]|nr:hypothetical protein [Nitrosomonas sp.]